MIQDSLEPFRIEAQRLCAEEKVHEIIFSGPTYQVCFDGEKEPTWVFLQLDHNDRVKDLFCQCERSADTGVCVHMAAACIAVFNNKGTPLHKRFEHSPFFSLVKPLVLISEGSDVESPRAATRRGTGRFRELARASSDRPSCRRQGLMLVIGSRAHGMSLEGPSAWLDSMQALVDRREVETEETSIKFSDATDEELEQWRQGFASDRLRVELSPFTDCAKRLFLLSEKEPCSFTIESKSGLPSHLTFEMGAVRGRCALSGTIGEVLDRLPLDRTTPRLDPFGGRTIKEVTFDERTQRCVVVLGGEGVDLSSAVPMEGTSWVALPGGGFAKPAKKRFSVSSLDEIAESVPLPKEAVALSYSIEVEENVGVTLVPYAREPHDLEAAHVFDHWLWHPQLGFQRLASCRFSTTPLFIPLEKLSDFFAAHRHFLAALPGYAVYERPQQETITFDVDEGHALCFHRRLSAQRRRAYRLGRWLYVPGDGFFPKSDPSRISFDIPIPPHRVAAWIRSERQWLSGVSGFFADHVPIQSIGLDIRLVRKEIKISPVYTWEKEEYAKAAIFYDDMGYVPGVGFFQLPSILSQSNAMRTVVPKEREQWDRFFLTQLPELRRQYVCTVDARLEVPHTLRLVCDGVAATESIPTPAAPQIWEAHFFWESEKGIANAEEILGASRRGERFVPTAAGLLDLSEERFGWLASVPPPKTGSRYRVRTFDFVKIKAHDDFVITPTTPTTTAAIIERLLSSAPAEPPDLSSFRSSLRPYQAQGVQWLWHLYLSGLSGLLCDDMGVGKTFQAMGLLAAVRSRNENSRFLILCPASLLWHWRNKLSEALPHFRVLSYVGGDRSLDVDQTSFDVFLTTYGIWRTEAKQLHKLAFDVAIFDELQIAKNHVSQIWKALSLVRSSMRLGLTGTPVENQVRELKAVFDLVVPGYLPDVNFFQYPPLQGREGTGHRHDILARYVRPFLLRRRKQDVLPELPSKTEDLYLTELVGEQKALYQQVAARQGASLIQQLRDDVTPIPFMHIFALLSALKQICNHPAAFTRDVSNFANYDSGKWDTFVELLEEALEGGQKVVVFSQFLAMLDIIELYLQQSGIGYAQIRGKTKNRGQELSRFQKDPSCQVFLGSLQASGLGIDLTAGSVVIHYDRWWNAARENQATDRVHRIGQTRGVMVYKLMTANTIEERIDRIITRKAKLFEDVISYDDHHILKKLNRSELLELLEGS
jgi:superfamily II DNA or RNA helicase